MINEKAVPRPEYPRPQMVREQWINLNGEWEFEIDHGKSGRERKLHSANKLSDKIIVPFCPESKLSGVEYKDFMPAVWYRRGFCIPAEWKEKRILMHFGAVDYDTEVWINGVSVGSHRGGYISFSFDITDFLIVGENIVTVCAEDDIRSGLQPRGKQSAEYHSHQCDYTRTTGIWQTVWLECVPQTYISGLKYIPDPDNGCLYIEGTFEGKTEDCKLNLEATFGSKKVGSATTVVSGNKVHLTLKLTEIHLWEPGKPNLYDIDIRLVSGIDCVDRLSSYFGLRSVKLNDNVIMINDKPVFQRLILDQGFYPDGVYTAPSDAALKNDIEISIGLGFNGARMHQKIFEPRYLYWADKLGYLIWGEHGSRGLDITSPVGLERFLPEWMDAIERDFNSPALVGWCPFNETWDKRYNNLDGTRPEPGIRQDDEVIRIVYNVTKAIDSTRPVIDASGNYHVVTDIFDIHDYEQNVEKFAAKYEPMINGGDVFNTFPLRQKYEGQPYFVSEYGGIWWNPDQKDSKAWGYGDRPKSEEEFIERYKGLTDCLLDNPKICAFCYTQLYDVEQEVNGLYTYDRKSKFNPEVIRKINARMAAIEK